jgi:hypothetical protein
VGGRGREWGQGEEMTQVLYAHMSNKTKKKRKRKKETQKHESQWLLNKFEEKNLN